MILNLDSSSLNSLIARLVSGLHSYMQSDHVLMQILAINTTARNACITGDLTTTTKLLTQDIDADNNDYDSYANRSFVMARKADWDHALDDAQKVYVPPLSSSYRLTYMAI
jgi:hypothetical protein